MAIITGATVVTRLVVVSKTAKHAMAISNKLMPSRACFL
jgi:hypothetical protein